MTIFKVALVVSVAIFTVSCGSRVQAPRGPGGERITLALTVGQVPGQSNASQIEELLEYLQPDLEAQLTKRGYVVVIQPNSQGFVPGPNRYNVVMQVTNYTLGYTGTATTLESKVELLSVPGEVLFSVPHAVKTTRGGSAGGVPLIAGDWRKLVELTNGAMTDHISLFLRSKR